MNIVLDANIIPPVFNNTNSKHDQYKPVLENIKKGKCVILRGGKKYNSELRKLPKYLRIIDEFAKKGYVEKLDDSEVNLESEEIIRRADNLGVNKKSAFDDPHIIAIVIIGNGQLIITDENRACPYFKNKDLYGGHRPLPKIYKKKEHSDLLQKLSR